MTVVVTHTTPSDGSFSATGAAAWDANHALSGIGTMAEQNANNVAITGGSISGVTLPAGGSTLQVQYNNAGNLGGMSGTLWDDTNRSLTLGGATLTTSNPVLNLSQTWNNAAVTFTGYKLNVTDTASNASSLLMDIQVGGASKFSIGKAGQVTSASSYIAGTSAQIGWTGGSRLTNSSNGFISINNSALTTVTTFGSPVSNTLQLGAADAAIAVAQTLRVQSVVAGTTNTAGANLTITGSQGTGTGAGGSIVFQVATTGSTGTAQNALATALTLDWGGGTQRITFNGTAYFVSGQFINSNGFYNSSSQQIINASGTVFTIGANVSLTSDAANTLAQRNGVNAQTSYVYSGYTDASNYSRLTLSTSATDATLETTAAGTYGIMALNIRSGATNLRIDGANIQFRDPLNGFPTRWQMNSTGFIPGANNSYDIGSSSTRPRYVYAGSAIVTPSTVVASLPAAATAGSGARSFVTDATMTMTLGIGTVVVGGGANKVPVYSDGTNWLIG